MSNSEEKVHEGAEHPAASSGDEDMADFTVVDEADMSGSEDDKSNGGNHWPETKYPAPRIYTDEDFEPKVKDPRCREDWPLAAYWPVYVGNFHMKKSNDKAFGVFIQYYFASKGLPAFMVYRWKDPFFSEYQKKVGIYDMLVYFCCEQDAKRAIEWCNRDLFYGHPLNVYCGRTPALFPKQKSWRMTHLREQDKLATEQTLETYLRRYGDIHCITKQDLDAVLVQYGHTFHDGIETFARENRVKCSPIIGPVSKQRYLEQDVEEEILQYIKDYPYFMMMRLQYKYLNVLKRGIIPDVPDHWKKSEAEIARMKILRPDGEKRSRNIKLLSAEEEVDVIKRMKVELAKRRNELAYRSDARHDYRPSNRSSNYRPYARPFQPRGGRRGRQLKDYDYDASWENS